MVGRKEGTEGEEGKEGRREGGRGGKGEEGGGWGGGGGHRGSGKGVGMGGVFDFCFFAVKWEGRRKSTTHLMDRNGLITNNGKWAKQGFSFSSSVDLVLLVTGRRLKVTKYDTDLAVCVSNDNKYDTELAVCVSNDNKYGTELTV